MPMKNPPHPGRSVRGNCLDPLGLSVTEAAEVLGVARHTLSRVLNGHAAISPDMAIRLEKAGWSSADFWLSRQTAYDLAQARKGEDRIRVERYQPLPLRRNRPPSSMSATRLLLLIVVHTDRVTDWRTRIVHFGGAV